MPDPCQALLHIGNMPARLVNIQSLFAMTDPELRRIDSRTVYKNRWMTIREDRVRRRNGADGLYGVVDKPDFSLIVPFDGEKFHLVQQFRYPVGGRYWEFPQGSKELQPDSTPEQVAIEELAEETGLVAGRMVKLGKLFQAYGYANQSVHVYLATDLTAGEPSPEAEEEGLITQCFTRDQCDSMMMDGRMADLASVAALHLLERHLRQKA